MRITVQLFASFRNGRFPESTLEVRGAARVCDVVADLGLPACGILLVNDRHAGLDDVLSEGDALHLFPPVGGG